MTPLERLAEARHAGFYPLMLLIERLNPDGPSIGNAPTPREEIVRFRHSASLAFSDSDVVGVEQRLLPTSLQDLEQGREIPEVTTSFLGLTGGVSPLPAYLTEELLQDEEGSGPARDFLDLFHDRLLSMLYRVEARYDLPNGRRSDCSDAWSQRLLLLIGFDGDRQPLPAWRLLRLAGLLGDGNVTAHTLEVALTDAVEAELGDAAICVEPFIGTWVLIDASQLTHLGRDSSRLGRDLLLGSRVFDRAGKFRVTAGPLSAEAYRRFAPEHRAANDDHPLRRMERVLAALVGDALDHEIVLWLSSDAAPTFELSAAGRTRLGQNSWLGSQSREARLIIPHAA